MKTSRIITLLIAISTMVLTSCSPSIDSLIEKFDKTTDLDTKTVIVEKLSKRSSEFTKVQEEKFEVIKNDIYIDKIENSLETSDLEAFSLVYDEILSTDAYDNFTKEQREKLGEIESKYKYELASAVEKYFDSLIDSFEEALKNGDMKDIQYLYDRLEDAYYDLSYDQDDRIEELEDKYEDLIDELD